ncbi:hypothetical protein KVT40_002041 [Elsinoe batatas]|uniref:Uncharacterized protein n=1 Tax=Elsinoe batatas TaxID=2601811 RepID=A0A8K0PJD7_9PEZI|nr:hypothetical protein KVT40_002041 [Elsinoe batatas]
MMRNSRQLTIAHQRPLSSWLRIMQVNRSQADSIARDSHATLHHVGSTAQLFTADFEPNDQILASLDGTSAVSLFYNSHRMSLINQQSTDNMHEPAISLTIGAEVVGPGPIPETYKRLAYMPAVNAGKSLAQSLACTLPTFHLHSQDITSTIPAE